MILLWGLPGDRPLAAVGEALQRLGHPAVWLDQRKILTSEMDLQVGARIEGRLRISNKVIDLETITAVYMRPYNSQQLPVIKRAGPDSPAWNHALRLDEALLSWVELTPALVVNRPAAMASNNSKPYQAALIQSHGFSIPETLITTDPKAVWEFWIKHGPMIYKSISGIRSIVSRVTAEHMGRLENISWCPTQFQQYITGNDYRVHVVGEEVFACEITSNADDYRYASRHGADVEIRSSQLPTDITDRCRILVKTMGLSVAGLDLRYGSNGEWYCFEVNPSPGFTYFQDATGQPIDEAIARLLAGDQPAPIY